MPSLSPRPCTSPGCRALVAGGSRTSRCGEHRPKAWATNEGKSPDSRDYGTRWRKLRKQQLLREPLCRICRALDRIVEAVTVDHIVPRAQGGKDDQSNLQSLCNNCHKLKTAREGAAARASRVP